MTTTCHNCAATSDSIDAAIDAGWIPSYWEALPAPESADGRWTEIDGPFCPDCIGLLGLVFCADTGDYEKR